MRKLCSVLTLLSLVLVMGCSTAKSTQSQKSDKKESIQKKKSQGQVRGF